MAYVFPTIASLAALVQMNVLPALLRKATASTLSIRTSASTAVLAQVFAPLRLPRLNNFR